MAPEENLLTFDDQNAVLKAVEDGILKQATQQLGANLE